MSSNLTAIRDAYDATSRGDVDKVVGFFAEMGKVYGDGFRVRVLDTLALDEHVVVLTSGAGNFRGEHVALRSAHVFRFRGERYVEFVSFQDDAYIDFWTARK